MAINDAENSGKQVQIVSLGAGSDTRFWRIAVREDVLWREEMLLTMHIVQEGR